MTGKKIPASARVHAVKKFLDWTMKEFLQNRERPQIIYYDPQTMKILEDGGDET